LSFRTHAARGKRLLLRFACVCVRVAEPGLPVDPTCFRVPRSPRSEISQQKIGRKSCVARRARRFSCRRREWFVPVSNGALTMKKALVAISAASVLIISGFESRGSLAAAPQASPSQPAQAQDPQDQPSIVGTWLASYDGGFRKALLQWHKDGTGSQLLNFAAKTGNALMGDWKMVDDQTVSAFLIGWSYDDNGDTLTGYFTKVETLS